jgi:Holliday junction resolvasome RuvABC endonuclease subunit
MAGEIKTGGVLALDLGTTTGWAARMPNGTVCSGTQSFKLGRFEGNGMQDVRFHKWVGDILQQTGATLIVFEEVRRHIGVDAAHRYGGFLAILRLALQGTTVPFTSIPVGTIKKHISGRGNASKDDVIAAVKKLGFTPSDDNEADAIAILHCAEAQGLGAIQVAA